MKAYLDIVKNILNNGVLKENRTGIDTLSIPGVFFEHDMADGYPLLTTKQVPFRLIASELEFFIKGITDKDWLIKRNNHIRDEWCSPDKVKYGHDQETKQKMMEERELGPIYGFQRRNFGGEYISRDQESQNKGIDQLKKVVETLKTNPNDRRMIVMARNPQFLHRMALPPCHYGFQVLVSNDKLHLLRNQRSVDTMLGLPFNIASYALLLHLLAKESGLKEGKLIGFLADTHIYTNHLEGAKEQINRAPLKLATIKTENFTSIFDREYTDTIIENYEHQGKIKFDVAV
ncbi:MAG: thymidylate synthase [Candidatus Absconditabacterales bacterium]|nr:thymidylate synthase [Candidatus Absconditabacterales bacterium]